MKIIRATTPYVVDLIKDKLLEDSDYPPDVFAEVLRQSIVDLPDTTYVLVAVEEDETVHGFLIANAAPEQKHVFVVQAWADPKVPYVSDKMFLRLIMWAESLGRKEIRAETQRDPSAFLRKWNFKTISRIIGFTIPDNYEELLLQKGRDAMLGKDDNDGRIETSVDAKQRAEKPVESVGSVSDGASGSGGSEVSGEIVPELLPQLQDFLTNLTGRDTTAQDSALARALSGSPSSELSPEATEGWFNDAVRTPMMRTFQRDIQPQIRQAFAGRGAMQSTRMAHATTQALTDLQTQMAAQLATAQREDQLLRTQLAESAANRQLQAVGVSNQNLASQLQMLLPFQDHATQRSLANYQEFLRTQPTANPALQLALGFTGQQHQQMANRWGISPGGLIGGAMGGMMLGGMSQTPFGPGLGGILGGIGGAFG